MGAASSCARVAVTGLGLASSLGLDSATACAAARAGLTRPSELSVQILGDDGKKIESVAGHPILQLTNGYEGIGRLIRIAGLAFEEFKNGTNLSRITAARSGLVICLPDAVGDAQDEMSHEDYGSFTNSILALQGMPTLKQEPIFVGRGGIALAVNKAAEEIDAEKWDNCVVVAVDSLIAPTVLRKLARQKRIKSSVNCAGLIPGEAGVFILLERTQSTQRAQASSAMGVISSVGLGIENNHYFSGSPPSGDALVNILRRIFTKENSEDWTHATIISHLNGEPYSSAEWAIAETRLSREFAWLRASKRIYPAMSFGDVGTASGSLALCIGLRALARGYAGTGPLLVTTSSDKHERAALSVVRPQMNYSG